ncbi:MAG: dephospho-CoA kinase [Burkholderiaceae bacterium]|jgi:dephospho-CoA kinase|nr:dephospho-CoA kinase [Burkholderiaceae bacterium]
MRIGLTGGIGSGKSTVGAMLARHGAAVIDSDAISRASTAAGGAALAPIAEAFGAHMIGADGALDRAAMRALVYRDAHARQRLEAIIHPLVGAESERQAQAALQAGACVLVFDVPLLVESGARWRSRVHHIVVVDCPPDTQVARVVARGGLSSDEVRRIIAVQATRAERLAAADIVVDNGPDVDLAALERAVAQLARDIGLSV